FPVFTDEPDVARPLGNDHSPIRKKVERERAIQSLGYCFYLVFSRLGGTRRACLPQPRGNRSIAIRSRAFALRRAGLRRRARSSMNTLSSSGGGTHQHANYGSEENPSHIPPILGKVTQHLTTSSRTL